MQDPLQLSELLCARLCHDLSGPLGALLGGLELAAEQGDGAEEAMALATEAALTLGNRLRLFRVAWAGEPGPSSIGEIRELAAAVGTAKRIEFDFAGFDPGTAFAPSHARVLLNILLLAMDSIAGPGRVAVAGAAGAEIVVMIEGRHAKWPAGLAANLNEEAAAWSALTNARSLQAPLAALLARQAGLTLSLLLPTGPSSGSIPLLLVPEPKR